uniref:SFRICE_019986 n=1 Tax=Spodoptera frugiperda TaxID=7108 RepID=A0A2H1V6E1_SPOFR
MLWMRLRIRRSLTWRAYRLCPHLSCTRAGNLSLIMMAAAIWTRCSSSVATMPR